MPAAFSTDEKSVPKKKRDQSQRRAGYQPKFTRAGRPGKRTPQLEKDLLAAIATGAPYRIACQACGISEDSLIEWRRKDPIFAKQVEEAAGKTALRLLKKIEANADENFSAAAWILERRFPGDFSRPEIQLQINNTTNQTTNNMLVVSAEVADAIESRMKSAGAKIAQLFASRRNGAKSPPDAPEPIEVAMEPVEIVMPADEPGAHWWEALIQGSGERPIERSTAEKVCRLIAEDALGHQRARSASIAFAADEPVLLRDVHAVIETLCGADGWTALRRRAE